MPSTPTTKSQVQAYRFVLRRMQSALVRRDSVMLHDPMRTHSRATLVGVVIAAIGMLGFIIFGLLKPEPKAPNDGIVIGKESGTVYIKTANPPKLVPTFNLASARLILMSQGSGGQGGTGGSPAAGGAPEVKEPEVVADDQLADIPRGRLQGIPGGPQLLPTEEQRISPTWSICDQIGLDKTLNDPTSINQNETTVMAGVSDLGRELADNEALLASADNGKTYLIYRLPGNPNHPNANAVRAEVDPNDSVISAALNLPDRARHISIGLLNAIPEVNELTPPKVPGADNPSNFGLTGLSVGNVFKTERADGPADNWVVTQGGIQRVSAAVADLIHYGNRAGSSGDIPGLQPAAIANVPRVKPGDPNYLDVDQYPRTVPTVLDPVTNPVSCLGWNVTGEGDHRESHTAVHIGTELPMPKDDQGNRVQPIDVGQRSPDGLKIDKFYMQPGHAAVIRSAASNESLDKGPISLISDLGMRYGVPDVRTAQGLGLTPQDPAPDSIVRLLPTGASLNTNDAKRTFDSVPVDPGAGSYPTDEPQAAGSGGQ